MTLGFSDGVRLWAVRYSSEGHSRTLYVSADSATLQALDPDNPRFPQMGDEDRIVVSEPLSDLPGAWLEVPEATALIVQPGAEERLPFRPRMRVLQAEVRDGDSRRAPGASP
jgi:predicted glutamine amidotransferase